MTQSSKRLFSMIFALIFILGAFYGFFNLVEPAYSNAQALRSKQLGEEDYLQTQAALVKQAQNLINTYKNESQTNVGLALPSGQDAAGALAQIEGIAAANSISITNINASAPTIQTDASGAATSSQMQKPLGSFSLRITATGAYENFKSFVAEIETNIRLFDVKEFSLQPIAVTATTKSGVTQDFFTGSLTVITYYQTP